MSARSVAREHYRTRSLLVRGLARLAAVLWGRVDSDNIAVSWAALVPALSAQLVAAQRAAAAEADTYLPAVLAAQGLPLATAGRVNVDALAGVASDGRDLIALLNQPPLTALTALSRGHTVDRAVAIAGATVQMIVGTQVADAGRAADAVSMTAHRGATGYRRMLVGVSCSRCVILAGRWYAYNAGFDRHPRCRPGATASTSLRARTPPTTCERTHASTSTASPMPSRTGRSRPPARRRSGLAPTRPRLSTPVAPPPG